MAKVYLPQPFCAIHWLKILNKMMVPKSIKLTAHYQTNVSCDRFLTLNWKLSSMSDFNQSFTVFEPIVDLIEPSGLETM